MLVLAGHPVNLLHAPALFKATAVSRARRAPSPTVQTAPIPSAFQMKAAYQRHSEVLRTSHAHRQGRERFPKGAQEGDRHHVARAAGESAPEAHRRSTATEAFAARRRPRADAAQPPAGVHQPPAGAARPRAAVLDRLPQRPGLVPPPLDPERMPVRVPPLRHGSVRLRTSLRGSRSGPWRSGKAPRGPGSTPGGSRSSVSAAARALVAAARC